MSKARFDVSACALCSEVQLPGYRHMLTLTLTEYLLRIKHVNIYAAQYFLEELSRTIPAFVSARIRNHLRSEELNNHIVVNKLQYARDICGTKALE